MAALAAGREEIAHVAYMLGTFPALSETFVLREISALQRRGLDITVCAIRRPDLNQHARLDAVATDAACLYARPDSLFRHLLANLFYLLSRPSRYLAGLRSFLGHAAVLPPREALQLLYHFVAGVGFCRDLRRRGITHVHCHFNSPTNIALAAHLVGGLRFSFTAHASADLFIRPVMLERKVASAEFVVAVCDYSRRFLDSLTGFRHSAKLHRIYNGIEELPARETAMPATRPFSDSGGPDECRILSVGNLVTAKGYATLIEVCAGLRERGKRFHCRIIGEGPERPTLERLVRAYALEHCVELAGAKPLDEVYAAMSTADVFVLLSEIGPSGYRDGFPTVILEAMAAGLPVVSTSLSGIPEMVLDGVTGKLVRERDVDGARQALECLLDSADLRHAMGCRGRARVREVFDIERSADQLAALLGRDGAIGRAAAGPTATER